MKILRNILLTLVVIFILAFIGIFIFIKTLDVNKFKPQITEQIQKILGRPVSLQSIDLALSFRQGIAVELKNLKIGEDPKFGNNDFLTVQSVFLNVDAIEYLKTKTVSLTKLTIEKPTVSLIRNEGGIFNYQSIVEHAMSADHQAVSSPEVSSSAAPKTTSQAAALPLLIVKSIELNHGEVMYQDNMPATLMTIPVKDIDVRIRDFSLDKSFIVEAQLSVFSQGQNIAGQGEVSLDMSQQLVYAKRFSIKSDLAQIVPDQLKGAIAALAPVNFDGGFTGELAVTVDQLKAGSQGLMELQSNLALAKGSLKLKEIYSPFSNMTADVDINQSDVMIKSFVADFSGGKIKLQGRLDDYLKAQKPSFKLAIENVSPAGVIDPKVLPAQLEGKLNAQFSGEAAGIQPDKLKSSLTSQGQLALIDGKIKDFNLLKIVLEKLSAVPAIGGINLGEAVESRLPESYKERLKLKDTIIDNFTTGCQIANGALQFNNLTLQSSGISAELNGQVGFDQTVEVSGQVVLDQTLSASLVEVNQAFEYLQNTQKEIAIPLTAYKGSLTQVRIYPDLKDFAKNAFINRGKEELKKVLFKALDLNSPSAETQSADQQNSSTGEQPAKQEQQMSPEQKAIEGLINQIPIFK